MISLTRTRAITGISTAMCCGKTIIKLSKDIFLYLLCGTFLKIPPHLHHKYFNMKTFFIYFFLLLFVVTLQAQDMVVTKGKIEFEKKINLHKEMAADAEGDDNWYVEIIKAMPQY